VYQQIRGDIPAALSVIRVRYECGATYQQRGQLQLLFDISSCPQRTSLPSTVKPIIRRRLIRLLVTTTSAVGEADGRDGAYHGGEQEASGKLISPYLSLACFLFGFKLSHLDVNAWNTLNYALTSCRLASTSPFWLTEMLMTLQCYFFDSDIGNYHYGPGQFSRERGLYLLTS